MRIALALVSLLFSTAAQAHDLWLERQGDGFVLRYGHPGAPLPIDAAKVKAIRCAAPAKELRESAAFAPTEVKVEGRCAALSATFEGGDWSLTPDGEKNLPRSKVPDAVKAWRSRQFAKWIDPARAEARAPVGDALEIVPVADLARVKRGDKATFRVLLEGKPVPGAIVSIAHRALGETDSAGEARVKLRATGTETIHASVRRRIASREVDSEVFEASLSFEVTR